MITAWSFSRLGVFEKCKYWAKLAYIDKIPEPPRPLPPGMTEHANDRGSRVHEAAELYVRNDTELIPELYGFKEEFNCLKEYYKLGLVSLEGEWAVDSDWMPVTWNSLTTWARIKLDVLVHTSPNRGVVIDYKTGKLLGKEIQHMEQGQLYQLAAFMRYPKLEVIDVEFWYTDQDQITRVTYTKDQGLKFLKPFSERGQRVVTEKEFKPNPSLYSCKYCPYGPDGTGHCKVGISRFQIASLKKQQYPKKFETWP